MENTMINPSVIDLLKKVDDRYSLVILSSKRARQLIDGAPKLSKRAGNGWDVNIVGILLKHIWEQL